MVKISCPWETQWVFCVGFAGLVQCNSLIPLRLPCDFCVFNSIRFGANITLFSFTFSFAFPEADGQTGKLQSEFPPRFFLHWFCGDWTFTRIFRFYSERFRVKIAWSRTLHRVPRLNSPSLSYGTFVCLWSSIWHFLISWCDSVFLLLPRKLRRLRRNWEDFRRFGLTYFKSTVIFNGIRSVRLISLSSRGAG